MYLAQARYQLEPPKPAASFDGAVIASSAVMYHTLVRRKLSKYSYMKYRLLDPQLYLHGLNPNTAINACTKLSSYSWFNCPSPPYYSSQQNQAAWKKGQMARVAANWSPHPFGTEANIRQAIASCISAQILLGCSKIILPSPLTSDRYTNYNDEAIWLDIGLQEAKRRGLQSHQLLATVAIADSCLALCSPESNPLINLVLDQVSARELSGVYIIFETSTEGAGSNLANAFTVNTLLYLVDAFSRYAKLSVFVNYFGALGLVARACGAVGFSTGWYRGERRLRLPDFESPEGAQAYPTFYSLSLASDLGLGTGAQEADLVLVYRSPNTRDLVDQTEASINLISALAAHRTPDDVPLWAYSGSNVTAARAHYNLVMSKAEKKLESLSSQTARLDWAQKWLERATKTALELKGYELSYRAELNHQAVWLDALQKIRNSSGL